MKEIEHLFESQKEYVDENLKKQLNNGEFIPLRFQKWTDTLKNKNFYQTFYKLKEETTSLKFVIEWLINEDKPFISFVLGEFGSGKSTTLYYLTNLINTEKYQRKIFFFDLKHLENYKSEILKTHSANDIFKIILNSIGFDAKLYLELKKQIMKGEVKVIFDSLDEFLMHTNSKDSGKLLSAILKPFKNKGKVLISVRQSWSVNYSDTPMKFIRKICKENGFDMMDVYQIQPVLYNHINMYIKKIFENQKVSLKTFIENIRFAVELLKKPMLLNLCCQLTGDDINKIKSEISREKIKTSDEDIRKNYLAMKETTLFYEAFVKQNVKDEIEKESLYKELAKKCFLTDRIMIDQTKMDSNKYIKENITNLRKDRMLSFHEYIKGNRKSIQLSFSHKSFMDYFFVMFVIDNLSNKREYFDKIELDNDARLFLIGLMGWEEYYKNTMNGWGLPKDLNQLTDNDDYRKKVAKEHKKYVKMVINPKDVPYTEWCLLSSLVNNLYKSIYSEPPTIRSLRYGLIVLSLVLDECKSWTAEQKKDARAELMKLLIGSLHILSEYYSNPKKISKQKKVIDPVRIEENVDLSFSSEIALLANTTLKIFQDWIDHFDISEVLVENFINNIDLLPNFVEKIGGEDHEDLTELKDEIKKYFTIQNM